MVRNRQNTWLICFRPDPQAKIRLLCFPYAGGGASIYRTWGQHLPPSIELHAIQLPGREMRISEPAFTQLQPLVQTLSDVLLPSLDKPFAFFGHSLGALLAFEVMRELRRQQNPVPMHLFVSARSAPQIENTEPPIHQLPQDEFIEKIRELDGTPEEVLQHPELMELVLPTLRADFSVYESYSYTHEAPLDIPISAFGGVRDSRISQSSLEQWNMQTSRSFSLRMFQGNHFFINSNSVRAHLIAALVKDLQAG